MAEISKKTLRLTVLAVLGALAIVLSALENMIPPLPMMPPGAKLGLSNLTTMFAAGAFGIPSALAIALLKGLFAGATRGLTAMLMSLAGGILSTLAMGFLFRLKEHRAGFLLIGVTGALCHNLGQLLVSVLLMGEAVLAYLPFLVLYALVTGSVTGAVLKILLPAVRHLKLEGRF